MCLEEHLEEQHVDVSGQEVRLLRRAGDRGVAVWLIHGLGDWSGTWQEVFASPRLRDRELFAPDLPGYGESNSIRVATEAVENLAMVVGGLARTVTPDRPFVLVGHSLGGVLATLVAAHRPANLLGILNVEGNLTAADCFFSGEAISAPDREAWYDAFTREIRDHPSSRAAMDSYAQGLELADHPTFFACSGDLVRLCRDDQLGRWYHALDLPKLYCHGDELSAESVKFLDAAGAERHEFRGAGHWVHFDAAGAFCGVLAEWLAQFDG